MTGPYRVLPFEIRGRRDQRRGRRLPGLPGEGLQLAYDPHDRFTVLTVDALFLFLQIWFSTGVWVSHSSDCVGFCALVECS